MIAEINIISLIRLIDGGAAIFIAVNINHHIDKVGYVVNIPFIRKILRVLVNSQVIFANANNAEDVSPWAIIISIDPINPQLELENIALNISPICPTDEYAIIDLRSG